MIGRDGALVARSAVDPSDPAEDGADLAGQQQTEPLLLPVHATRGASPGPKGCWAVKRDGVPCGAAAIRGAEYCAAHSGRGVAGDPAKYSPLGAEKRRQNGAVRAELRVMYGNTRQGGVRAALRAAAERQAIALAGSALNAALDPDVDILKRGQHALAVIEAVDPARTSQVSVAGEIDPQAVDNLSLSELVALAGNMGLAQPGSPVALNQPDVVPLPSDP